MRLVTASSVVSKSDGVFGTRAYAIRYEGVASVSRYGETGGR